MGCRNNNVAGTGNRNRCACVYECLLELLESASENNNICCGWVGSGGGSNWRHGCGNQVESGGGSQIRCDCDCVYDCLIDLLESATEDPCRCPR